MIRRMGDNTSTEEDRCLELSLALFRKFIMFCNNIVLCNITTMLCLLVVYSSIWKRKPFGKFDTI